MPDPDSFISYAFQDLTQSQIEEYAGQYKGVNMREMMYPHADQHPFLVKLDNDYAVVVWNEQGGTSMLLDEDSVRVYATLEYMKNNDIPKFDSFDEAEKWAESNGWQTEVLPPK